MRIQCPHCGASGEIDESKRPAGATSIRCPRCSNTIPFDLTGAESESIKQPKPEPVSALQSPIPQTFPGNETIPKPSEKTEISGISSPVAIQRNDAPVKGVCSLCFETFPREDMLRFDSYLVCASCKPIYEQMLQEGVSMSGSLLQAGASMPGSLVYSGFWRRFAAKFIDGLILGTILVIVCVVMLILLFKDDLMSTGKLESGSEGLIQVVFYLIYYGSMIIFNTFFIGKYGATPGKMALGIRVVNPSGHNISYKRAFGRSLAEILSYMTCYIGFLIMLFDSEKRTLHDMICDTRVILK